MTTDQNNQFPLNLYNVQYIGDKKWDNVVLFAKELTSKFIEGPSTFNKERTIIYFTRTKDIYKKLGKDTTGINHFGIYKANIDSSIWVIFIFIFPTIL